MENFKQSEINELINLITSRIERLSTKDGKHNTHLAVKNYDYIQALDGMRDKLESDNS